MKKRSKIVVIIATVCIAVGLALTGTSFALADFDLRNLSTDPGYERKSYLAKSTDFEEIVFEGTSENVRIEPSPDESFHVEHYRGESLGFEITEDDGILRIVEKHEFRLMVFNFNFDFGREVVIQVPESFTGDLSINTSSGNLFIQGFSHLKSLQMQSVSGMISIDSVSASESMQVQSTSGNISADSLSTQELFAGTASGQIRVTNLEAARITSDSASGNIDFMVKGLAEDYAISTSSVSGNINAPQGGTDTQKSINLSTVSGNIALGFA